MVLLLLAGLLAACAGMARESFSERLTVRPLGDGSVVAHAAFEMRGEGAVGSQHFHLFPRALGQVLQRYSVRRLRVSLAAGRWRAERWEASPFAAPEGLLLEAHFAAGGPAARARWDGLCEGLGALLGASAGFVRAGQTVPMGQAGFFGLLPGEVVCTENLTPWLHMLPCRGEAGFASLLDPLIFFSAQHHALGIEYDAQKGSLVFHAVMNSASSALPASWTGQSLFGKALIMRCSLADKATLTVDTSLCPGATGTLSGEHEIGLTPFELQLQIPAAALDEQSATEPFRPRVNAHRFLTGTGLEHGGMQTHIWSGSEPIEFDYLDIVPWYFRVRPSSLQMSMNAVSSTVQNALIQGKENESPSVIQLRFKLASNSSAVLSYDFDKAFMHLTDYPPDAHLGFFFPGARIRVVNGPTIWTDSQVAQTALPDFSMPFNVITLSGIMLGYFFGAVLGLVTTRYSLLKRGSMPVSQRPLARLLRKISALIDGPQIAENGHSEKKTE